MAEVKKPYYECHVTMYGGTQAAVKKAVEAVGWTFSAIDNDIILGEGVKCYATHHYNADKLTLEEVTRIVQIAGDMLRGAGCKVIRQKVELVQYDERFS